jgi:hypothetical protein
MIDIMSAEGIYPRIIEGVIRKILPGMTWHLVGATLLNTFFAKMPKLTPNNSGNAQINPEVFATSPSFLCIPSPQTPRFLHPFLPSTTPFFGPFLGFVLLKFHVVGGRCNLQSCYCRCGSSLGLVEWIHLRLYRPACLGTCPGCCPTIFFIESGM